MFPPLPPLSSLICSAPALAPSSACLSTFYLTMLFSVTLVFFWLSLFLRFFKLSFFKKNNSFYKENTLTQCGDNPLPPDGSPRTPVIPQHRVVTIRVKCPPRKVWRLEPVVSMGAGLVGTLLGMDCNSGSQRRAGVQHKPHSLCSHRHSESPLSVREWWGL